MLTLNFHSFGEQLPEHNQDIVCLKRGHSFDAEYFEPIHDTVEYVWIQLEDGEDSGAAVCYDPEDTPPEPEVVDGVEVTYKLQCLVDGYAVQDDWFWMSQDDYWAAFDKALGR